MPLLVTPRQLSQRAEFYHQAGQLLDAGISLPQALSTLQQAPPARGVLGWLGLRWQPALAAAAAVALAVGISLYRPTTVATPTQVAAPQGSPAVSDLEKLDKNAEVYNNFDMLYDDEENSSQ